MLAQSIRENAMVSLKPMKRKEPEASLGGLGKKIKASVLDTS